jgi:hypothetical protein
MVDWVITLNCNQTKVSIKFKIIYYLCQEHHKHAGFYPDGVDEGTPAHIGVSLVIKKTIFLKVSGPL